MPGIKVTVNGKFLRVPSTGVHRVAAELANALGALKLENHPAVRDFDFELLVPGDGVARARSIALPRRVVNFMTGIPWEQFTLPLVKGRSLLLNLCNIGPVLSGNSVTMIHDVQVHLSPQSYSAGFRWWYRLVQPAFARRHRLLLTVSEFSRREIARIGLAPVERIAVIPNGVDHALRVDSDDTIVTRLGLAPQRFVLALATTQAHKNISILLRAFAKPRGDLRLVLFGSANREDFKAAGHDVPEAVIFAGRVTDEELKALMQNALCLAFPSTTEGFGLPPVEAMRLGCPAIVAPCGALPEVCGDAALYVEPDDCGGWSDAIARLADDAGLRREMIERGQERSQAYTWQAAALKLVAELRRLE